MTIEIDTHAHTLVSGHAYNTMREMVQMAAEKGLKGLALTEHAPKMPGSTNLYYFENKEDILKLLKQISKPGDVILFKASNATKFYELAEKAKNILM